MGIAPAAKPRDESCAQEERAALALGPMSGRGCLVLEMDEAAHGKTITSSDWSLEEEIIELGGIVVLDNASWHKTKSMNWHHIEPVYLPPYSPDFNPIERLWQHLKSHYLTGCFTKD